MDDINKHKNKTQTKKYKILIVFGYITADMLSTKNIKPIVTELFVRGRKLNIYLVFIIQSYFKVPKNIRLYSTHYFIKKIPSTRELQQTAFNHVSYIDFEDFINLYKKCAAKAYTFLIVDAFLASDNPLRFRKHISERT